MTTTTARRAIVKLIVSGDTLVVKPLGPSANESEQRISLNYVSAPKLARPPTETGAGGVAVDEPYAFEAREYLRKKLVGQEISYTVDFQIPQSNRLMCTVNLGKDKETSENIIESLVTEGLVELRQQTGPRAADPKYQRLTQIDAQAKTSKRGRYSDDSAESHIRNIKWTLDNPKQFVDEHKSSPLVDAIVEFIRDGNTVRCLLLPSYYLVTVQLTGIKCPMLKRENSATNETNEPFAEEAKQFIETRLLQREVKVQLDGVNNQNLVGTVLHPNGNIAVFLLREGLAKCVDWNLTLLKQDWREKYRAAEKYAKDNRLRIWKNYVPQPGLADSENTAGAAATTTTTMAANGKSSDPSGKGYQAKVLEVVNGDALTIRDLRDNKIRKIYLSSVRAPRAADLQPKSDDNTAAAATRQPLKRPLYEIPYLFEARELLRKRLTGKTVRVVTDYIQPASNDYPEKICCTVYAGNVNVGEALISKGLAKALRHRQDDEQRSSRYDDLLTAEQQAGKRGAGLFSTGSGLPRIVDMTGETNKERAKGSLSVLQRNGRMEGMVEFVGSGSRFRVHLFKDNWVISFLLSSINCPRPERRNPVGGNSQQQKTEPGEPFGAEALEFARENLLQRDVFVEVESMDRGGNFIGRLTTSDGKSAALMLVQAGLAKVHDSAYSAPDYKQLLEAEEKCRKDRIGVWKNYEEPTEKENEVEISPEDESVNEPGVINFNDSRFRRVVLTYATNEFKLYVQYAEQGQKVEKLQNDLREIFNQTKPVGGHTPKKGEFLAARFTQDNEWYRARVEKIEGNNRISVYFVDYGNREVITDPARLTTLPPGYTQLPGQAHECELAYVRPPPDEDDRQDSKNSLLDEVGNDECLMKVEYRQNNTEFISLYRASTKENIVKNLAEKGLIVIGQRQKRSNPLYQQLEQAQAIAKSARRGLWQYSDQIEDDATEFGYTGRK